FLGDLSTLPRGSLGNDLKAGDIGRVAVVFPADEPGNAVPLLHAGACEHPMLRLDDDPVAPAVDRLDVSRTQEQAFVGSALGERTVFGLPLHRVAMASTIRPAAEHDAVRPAVATRPEGGDPAHGVAREEHQVHAGVAHPFDATELADIPILVV